MTVVERLRRLQGRPILLGLAALNAVTGLAALAMLAPLSFGADADFLIRGGRGLLAHQFVPDFVFSPLAAAAATPLTWVSPSVASLAVSLTEAAVLLVLVNRQTVGLPSIDRVLVAIAVFGFLPVVNELVLGQVTILICAGLYPAVAKDSWRRGIGLGVVLATIPKPFLGPVLIWMLFRRRKALMAGVVVAVLLSSAGIIALGSTSYLWWAEALRGAGEVRRHGNISVWADGMTAGGAIAATLVLVAFGVAMRDETQGLAAALFTGLLLAPYTLVYALAILVLLLGRQLPTWRLGAAAYALPANVLLPLAGTLWLVAGLGLSTFRWHEERLPTDPGDRPELRVSA